LVIGYWLLVIGYWLLVIPQFNRPFFNRNSLFNIRYSQPVNSCYHIPYLSPMNILGIKSSCDDTAAVLPAERNINSFA